MSAEVLLVFSLISGAALSLLWLGYRLSGLGHTVRFRLSRAMLVTLLVLSLLLPLLAFVPRPAAEANVAIEFEAPLVVLAEPAAPAPAPAVDWSAVFHVASIIYIIGVCLCLLWVLAGLVSVAACVARGERRRLPDGTVLVLHSRNVMPFTWGRWIVMSRADHESDGAMLLAHEQAHHAAAHWADLLLARLISCLDWYWPTAWLLTRDLAEVHEFEADGKVVAAGFRAADYQRLLISHGAPSLYSHIVNPFNYHSLKNRITMMQKRKSSSGSPLRALALLPFAALVVGLASAPALASAVKAAIPSPADNPAAASAENDTIFSGNGEKSLDEILVVSYAPANSTTRVTGAGMGAASSTQNDTINFDNGRVIYHDPANPTTRSTVAGMLPGLAPDSENGPKVILDGKVISRSELDKISTDNIKSVTVWKDQAAAAKYDAPNGVILVSTKGDAAPSSVSGKPMVSVAPGTTPRFPGGENELYRYLSMNVRYPEEAIKANLQGRVVVQFIVDTDGSIVEPKIIRSQGDVLDAEALRVVSSMPKFEPGTLNGEPIAAWFTLPVSFKLEGGSSAKEAEPAPKPATPAEEHPQYPGGDTELFKFIASKLRYPEEAVKANAQGRVIVTFKINTDGSISDAKVMRNTTGSEALAQEALRVTGLLPKFIPGKKDGTPVAVWYALPYSFKLQ